MNKIRMQDELLQNRRITEASNEADVAMVSTNERPLVRVIILHLTSLSLDMIVSKLVFEEIHMYGKRVFAIRF